MYTIDEINKILKGNQQVNDPDLKITTVLTDSRKLTNATETLFFAIKGDRLDGHHYIAELYEQGVRNFVVEYIPDNLSFIHANFFKVDSAVRALQLIAAHHRVKFKIPTIGITGSNGKTIIKEWCHQLLQDDYNICRSPKSYNSQIGVPLSVWHLNSTNTLAVFEAGISEPGEMEFLEKIIQPTIGIFSNIGAAHGINFIRDEHKVREKLKLFINAETLIFCADHNIVNQTITNLWGKAKLEHTKGPKLLSWGENSSAQVRVTQQETIATYKQICLQYNNQQCTVQIPFTDASSVENVMHLVVLLIYFGYSEKAINTKLSLLQRIAMRLEQKAGVNNCLIINDSYNSDIDSLKIALDFLAQQQKQPKRTLILSDILQSGMASVDLYQSVFNLVNSAGVNRFIGIGENLMQHKYLIAENDQVSFSFYPSTQAFLTAANDLDFQNEAILLKGARKFLFERISQFLEEKAHATVLEINLNAVVHNFQFFSSILKENTKIMVMVKAFSYGAGSFEIAKLLEFHRVDYLGVAYADEGVALRKAGIKTPIMVLNPERRSFEAMIRYNLEPEIYSFGLLEQLVAVLNEVKHGGGFPIHINIDTGMRRLGFELHQIDQLIEVLSHTDKVKVKGIFSHLAASDDQKWDDFTSDQINRFDKASSQMMKVLKISPIRHIANSNAIARFPNAHFDMVRLGLGLYGVNEKYRKQLQPVGTLKSTISQIKMVAKGETVGYGRVGVANSDRKIATIAIGYADGMNRLLSNGVGAVWLNGYKAPIIGNVCMDMTMIDITDIPDVQEGDMVEIFGDNISVEELAVQMKTISYEVLTSVSERVKRVYFVE